MDSNAAVWLIVGGLTVFVIVLRFVLSAIFNKAGNAVSNKLAERKNEKLANKEENLADKYK